MTISISWLTYLFFITIRMGTLLLFSPIQAIRQLPVSIRLLLIFIMSFILTLNLPTGNQLKNTAIISGAIAEFVNGLILATSLFATFAIFQIAGQLIDNETGLNTLAIFNPGEHTQESLTSHLLSMLAVLFFFGLDGHIWLFNSLSYSFFIIPPGTSIFFNSFTPIIKQFGFMFTMSFMIASPIILALLIVEFFGALITRNMPQINTYFFTLPLKILLGLFLLMLMLDYINPVTQLIFDRCFQSWQDIMS